MVGHFKDNKRGEVEGQIELTSAVASSSLHSVAAATSLSSKASISALKSGVCLGSFLALAMTACSKGRRHAPAHTRLF